MTREEAIEMLRFINKNVTDDIAEEALDMAIEALSAEPCGDCVSRKAVLHIITDWFLGCGKADGAPTMKAQVRALPAVQPVRPNEWIPVSERLPEIDDYVLATDGEDMFVAWYCRDGKHEWWRSCDDLYDENTPILAWMHLPEQY